MKLISIASADELDALQKSLKKIESKIANQQNLAVIGVSIILLSQAQSIPANLAVWSLDLSASYIEQIRGEFETELPVISTALRTISSREKTV